MTALALTPKEANHALKCAKHCHCATCLGVKLAFAATQDSTLRIEVRESRVIGVQRAA